MCCQLVDLSTCSSPDQSRLPCRALDEELAAHVRAWALEQELCVLAGQTARPGREAESAVLATPGQNQSPTGTLAVPRLCWQEAVAEIPCTHSHRLFRLALLRFLCNLLSYHGKPCPQCQNVLTVTGPVRCHFSFGDRCWS